MLFLAFKKSRNGQIHSYPLQIPNTQLKKKPAKFSIPPTGGPLPSLNAIGKPCIKSECHEKKKKKKDMERTNVM